MVIDPFKDPEVKEKMLTLQQKKYRQGHRNAKDKNGNPVYVLTMDDKISCLPAHMQDIVRSDQRRVAALEDYAKPFEFTVGIGEMPPNYIVNITHPKWGHARRTGRTNMVDYLKDPESWFKQQINEMKKELGYTDMVDKIDLLRDKLEQKKEKGYSVTDRRTKVKSGPLHCPDHGNELVPGSEPGTLICTVVGCKKVARKKARPTQDDQNPAVEELTKSEELNIAAEREAARQGVIKDLAQIEEHFKNAADVTGTAIMNANMVMNTSATMKIIQDAIIGAGRGRFTPNTNRPVLENQNGRSYLVQQVGPGREAYVDITDIIESRMSSAGGNAVRYANVAPVMLHPGQEMLVLKVQE